MTNSEIVTKCHLFMRENYLQVEAKADLEKKRKYDLTPACIDDVQKDAQEYLERLKVSRSQLEGIYKDALYEGNHKFIHAISGAWKLNTFENKDTFLKIINFILWQKFDYTPDGAISFWVSVK